MNKLCYLLLALMFFIICGVSELYAQDSSQSAPEFTIGAFAGGGEFGDDPVMYDTFYASGMNTIVQIADNNTYPFLNNLNVIASNHRYNKNDWIGYYSTSYYSKWESEENHLDIHSVGVKHTDGQSAEWLGEQCWSTIGVTAPACSLVYGPHYRQAKGYKPWTHSCINCVRYNTKYRMALDYDPEEVSESENVCVIKVVHRFNTIFSDTSYFLTDTILVQDTLQVADFNVNGSFKDFQLPLYEYDSRFYLNESEEKMVNQEQSSNVKYWDSDGNNGIQFWVEWLREGTLCTLYIDYAEVYDNDGWNRYILNPNAVSDTITAYAQRYSNWDNIAYWYGHDEPYTIDAYTPMRVVDEIVTSAGGAPLITEFYPYWDVTVNGDTHIVKYAEMVEPQTLMIDYYPFSKDYHPIRPVDLESVQKQFQIAHSAQPDFWYVGQGFGVRKLSTNEWCSWRRPDSSELKATVMLALAHGVKGIMFWTFDSYNTNNFCTEPAYFDAIVGKAPNYYKSELWYLIRNNFAPRLKGKLGKTLLTLDYTGNYFNLAYQQGENPLPDRIWRYFRWKHYGNDYHWHIGFLQQKSFTDNEYFMIANQRVDDNRTVNFQVQNITDFENVSMRDIEGGVGEIDTTIANSSTIEFLDEFPAGEGKLYQVAPVVKYGGRLIYNEDVGEGQILTDEMTIENGATLTVYGTYTAEANITVKDGNIVNGENGKIIFKNGTKLIIEGTASINGSSSDKLNISFTGQDTEYGILVNPEGSLTISNCVVENAVHGIKSMVDAGTINFEYVDFNNCTESAVTMLGQTVGGEQVKEIKHCTITNSKYGISASNLQELLIQDNQITNTEAGIFLSNVTRVIAFDNIITTNAAILPGIMTESTGGEIYANIINGHTNGIHLGNSSPDIGSNNITNCLFHGMYIGSGSLPDMQGSLIYNQQNHLWYAVSGYNKIYENGGYEGGAPGNDGSEIYFSDGDALMREGCNSIYDDREPSGSLINTEYLMSNNIVNPPFTIKAEYNFWGHNELYPSLEERFNNLTVNFEPNCEEPCPLPDETGEEKIITKGSNGSVIDTLYALERNVGTLTENEIRYSKAEEKFITGDFLAAEIFYDLVIESTDTLTNKLEAYSRKYEIGRLLNRNTNYFNSLQNSYELLEQTSEDSLVKKIFNQLSNLCLVGQTEYIPAIGEFDNIVQQNPGSEKAVYAEIDALTTSLLVEGGDSTLQKGILGKYLVKGSEDYLSRIDNILRKNFGSKKETSTMEIIPKEYTLYQNFPNPFNPVTTIKYDLPKAGEVELVVYDILGRKVKTLVNQTQQAGRYEIQFSASSLASGVYIYQLKTKDFVNSKKMILLK